MRARVMTIAALVALLLATGAAGGTTAATAQPERFFPETGFYVGGRFLAYWEAHGGLALNGFPITNERRERLEDGNEYTVQYFERARLEYHPENAPPYDMLLGQFGRRYQTATPPSEPGGGRFFPETGHNLEPPFRAFWEGQGGLPQFGYPLTEIVTETLEDGREYRVQYFERARLEYHPDNQPPYDVLLGQFGRRVLAEVDAGRPDAARPAPADPPFDAGRVALRAERAASGFDEPLFVTHAGDGSGRLFVLERGGRVRLLDGAVFLDLTGRVAAPPLRSRDREQGLLGLAFHPRFRENGYLYVHYNDRDGDHVVSRFTARGTGPADPASEKVLLTQDQTGTSFNGGMLAFGPDGYLYLGLGTGGAVRELQDNAQDLGSLLGKILRFDVDGGDPYSIPASNPFIDTPGARPEVWAYGLRNPYRFSFDRATGDLYLGGPGEFEREWINFQPGGTPGGRNFGWPILEGTACARQPDCDTSGIYPPILEYPTYEAGNCVVIGGNVARGPDAAGLGGAYLYGDFCSGRVWAAGRDAAGAWVTAEALKLDALISSFGEDEAGALYVTDIRGGAVYRLVGDAR